MHYHELDANTIFEMVYKTLLKVSGHYWASCPRCRGIRDTYNDWIPYLYKSINGVKTKRIDYMELQFKCEVCHTKLTNLVLNVQHSYENKKDSL